MRYPIAICADPRDSSAERFIGHVMYVCGLVPTVRIEADDPSSIPDDCVGVIGFGMLNIRRYCEEEGIRVHMLPPDRDWSMLARRFVPQLLEHRGDLLQNEFSESLPVQFRDNLTVWPTEFNGSHGERYVFIEPIGIGGTAVVARFCDQRGNTYAVKSLSNHRFPRELTEDRFSREAELLSQVDHLNVVHIVDKARIPQGHVILMEDLPAGSLHDQLQREAPDLEIALQWIREILVGVQALHDREIVHRDLTPKNLLFRDGGELVVSDFGTVRHLDDATITNSADQLGSLIYSAPEQIADPHHADQSADVYSVGQIAFLLCTGIQPLGNTGELRKHASGVPREVADALEAFRSYDPGDRPADADAALTSFNIALQRHRERTQPWRPVVDLCEQFYGPLHLVAEQLRFAGQRSWILSPTDAYLLMISIRAAVEGSVSWLESFEAEGGRLFALQRRDQSARLPDDSLGVVRGPELHVESGRFDVGEAEWTNWKGSNGLITRLAEWRHELLSGQVAFLPSAFYVDRSGPVESASERIEVEKVWEKIESISG